MENVLVTGGAGFIGSHLCNRLLSLNYMVICVDNFDNYYSKSIKEKNISQIIYKDNFKMIEEDILNYANLKKIFNKYEITNVYHLAAKAGVRPSIEYPFEYNDVNIKGTLNLLELSVKSKKVKKFFYASSSSVYGNNTKVPFSEYDEVNNPISPYAATKRSCELLCYTYHHLYNLPIACGRFFTVYGPRQRPEMAIHKFTRKIYNNEEIVLYGDGKLIRDYTYIDDIIDGIIKIMNKDFTYDIINIGGGQTTSLIELIKIIEKHSNKKAKIKYEKKPLGDVDKTYADTQKAFNNYDIKNNNSIDGGIKKFVKWYKQQNIL